MLLSALLVGVTALAAGIKAQSTTEATTTASSISTSTSSSAAVTHSVAVGANGFKFEPDTVTNASVGDIIEFRFYPTGHSVVRSEYKYPCIPYEDTGANKIGFYSGIIDVATITNDGPTFSVMVNDTDPIFFYCDAPGSCIDNYMIGVINPNDTETLDVQLEFTKNTTLQMTPGEAMPSETAASTSTGAASTSTAGSSGDSGGHSSSPLSPGAIAGIAIGGAVVVLMAVTLIYLCGRRGGLDKAYSRGRHASAPPMVEAKYTGPGPKSPGQETFATTAYSTTPSNDPYQQQQGRGVQQGYSVSSGSPPPMSVHSQNSYQHFGSGPGLEAPLMQGVDNGTMQTGFFTMPQPTGTHASYQQRNNPNAPPVELPTSKDPGNSPLPHYSNAARTFSWSTGGEGTYRPGKPAS